VVRGEAGLSDAVRKDLAQEKLRDRERRFGDVDDVGEKESCRARSERRKRDRQFHVDLWRISHERVLAHGAVLLISGHQGIDH
jgi:hypothetical protein